MSKPNQKELMKNEIRWMNVEGKKYFNIDDLRSKYSDLKFNTDNLIDSPLGKYVAFTDIQEMTDFDNKILTALNFNPRK